MKLIKSQETITLIVNLLTILSILVINQNGNSTKPFPLGTVTIDRDILKPFRKCFGFHALLKLLYPQR